MFLPHTAGLPEFSRFLDLFNVCPLQDIVSPRRQGSAVLCPGDFNSQR